MRMSFKAKKNNNAVNKEYKPVPSAKENHARWVGFPNQGVWSYRCGNLDCARLIPFGCNPNELAYCPYCGTKMNA